ncbi:MAG TPA: aminotransferase class I/II-fold pyridoxal phosphate-dependent enzyme [Blastocatellia bacterium]|nr:aminotransferase class I/II-fold pyridoxal phosphate-dependent enzyme [Blastocatellia bacterium]
MGAEAIKLIAEYYESIRDLPVYPNAAAQKLRENLDESLPIEGEDVSHLFETFRDFILPMSRHNGHPRFFGYVSSPGTALTAFADLLASALNANVTSWRSAPASTEIERITIGWIKQILNYDKDAVGLFTSGGSMANFAGLAAALFSKAPANLIDDGARALEKRMRVYMSEEGHFSITKAAGLLGLGRSSVRAIRVNERFQIDVEDLIQKIEEDLSGGYQPFCVVANAGTVSTGACDALAEVAEVAEKYNLWFHVDASYGGFAALAPSAKHLFDGIAGADSVSLDPHKWLYLPIDCGCVLYRDGATARAAYSHDAEYTRVVGDDIEEFAFWDYTPELSRRFRALKVWMMLKNVGARHLGQAIEQNINCAKHLASLVDKSDDFEMLAPVELSIFCFRYVPPSVRKGLERADSNGVEEINRQLDTLNKGIMVELQRDGSSYLSNALINGRFALRGCVINYRTTLQDIEVLLEDIRRVVKCTRLSAYESD